MLVEKSNLPDQACAELQSRVLGKHSLIIASNRGPVTFVPDESGGWQAQRGEGGLVTALTGLARQAEAAWIASPMSEGDRAWLGGELALDDETRLKLSFINPDPAVYDQYYSVISNPLLWFLQHSMWDYAHEPTITRQTWQAWESYTAINRMFADEIVHQTKAYNRPSLVMLQDYHLYLAPTYIRQRIRGRNTSPLTFFVHIPWPGPEDWGVLPGPMRLAILEGLCAVDLVGFQTRNDALNFIRTVETFMPQAHVNYQAGRIWYRNHTTHVRDFPISIDVQSLRETAATEEVEQYRLLLEELRGDRKLIVRIDRTEPSKNIVRGFHAYEEMLEIYPEHREKVMFLALMVPSRMEVGEYQTYLDELMAAAGRVNVRFGNSEWEPVRVLVGESYARAVAAMQISDVLLVNPIADGMNLVAKEGPTVNRRDGVVVLSERAGAHQQLGADALVVPPCDIYTTAQALHLGLDMPQEERAARARRLRDQVEREDIAAWLCWQLGSIERLGL